MGLKKSTKRLFKGRPYVAYKWRVLLPTLGFVWLLTVGLSVYQYYREEKIRANFISGQLDMITYKIVDAYGDGYDIQEFVNFVDEFFDNTSLTGLRVSVYNHDGSLVNAIGKPLPFDFREFASVYSDEITPEMKDEIGHDISAFSEEAFYFTSQQSADGKIFVLTSLPLTRGVDNNLQRINHIWIVVIVMALIVSAVLYIYIHYVSRSIRLLSKFAYDVANGYPFEEKEQFPNDEVGRISREIVSLYRQKDKALEETEREHNIALNAIKEKARFKREMTNNVSHELKTPIGIIKGYIDTIMSQPDMDPDTIRRFLANAQSNVDRLTNMMNDLSMITRLEDGTINVALGDVNFHDLVYTVADEVRMSHVCDHMVFKYDIPLDCHVKGSISVLQSMLYNLIRNASRHSKGTEMGIEMVSANERFCTFRFYDNGTGVPDEALDHLFERFYRVDKGRSRKTGDTGLGLPIVQHTVLALGGAISVKNRSTGGLEFTFTLVRWRNAETKESDSHESQENLVN